MKVRLIRMASAFCACAGLAGCAEMGAVGMAPTHVSGALQTTLISRQPPGGDSELIGQQTGAVKLRSYVYQPWVATVRGGANVLYEARDGGGDDAQATRASGEVGVSVLPLSRVPFSLNYLHSDNRVDGDFSGSDFTRDRAGVTGRAKLTDSLTATYAFSHDQIDRDEFGEVRSDRADVTMRQTFHDGEMPLNIVSVGLGFQLYDSGFDAERAGEPDASETTLIGSFDYRAEPSDNLTHDFRTTFLSSETASDDQDLTRMSSQSLATLQWRPQDRAFTATAAARALFETLDYGPSVSEADAERALLSLTGGVSWPVNEQLSVSVGLRGSFEQVQISDNGTVGPDLRPVDENFGGAVLGSASYRSLTYDLAGFDWRWNARTEADLGYETEDGIGSRARASLGHSLERSISAIVLDPVTLGLFQDVEIAHVSDDDDEFTPRVSHSASLSHTLSESGGATFARLFLRDTHELAGDLDEFQSLQFDLTRRENIDRDQQWQGNFGLQLIRQMIDGEEESYFAIRGDLSYQHRNLFGVEDLYFLSDLRVNAVDLDEILRDRDAELNSDFFRNDWRNRIEYRVGRLVMGLEGTVFQEDEEFGHFVLMRVRRNFGGEF